MSLKIPQTPQNSPDRRPEGTVAGAGAGAAAFMLPAAALAQASSPPGSPDERARTSWVAASPMSSFGHDFAAASLSSPAGASPDGSPASNSSGGSRKRKAEEGELDGRSPYRRKLGDGRMMEPGFLEEEGRNIRRLDETGFGAAAGSRGRTGAGRAGRTVHTSPAQSPSGSPAGSQPTSPARGAGSAGSAAPQMMSAGSLIGFDDAAMDISNNEDAASTTSSSPLVRPLTWAPPRARVDRRSLPLRLTTEAMGLTSLNNSDDDSDEDETRLSLLPPPEVPARPRRRQLDFGTESAGQGSSAASSSSGSASSSASAGRPLETQSAAPFQFVVPTSPAKKAAGSLGGSFSSPVIRQERYETKAQAQAAQAPVQTPPKVSAAIATLKGAKLTAALPASALTKVRMGMAALQGLSEKGSPRSAEKAKDLAARVERTVYDKMAGIESEKADTEAYHMAGISGFHTAKWARAEVFDHVDQTRLNAASLGAGSGSAAGAAGEKTGAGLGAAAPLRFFDAKHLTSAEKRGTKSVGLHIISKNFDELYAWVSGTQQVSATTGVVTGRYLVKADKNSAPKATSCFPPAISTFEQLVKIASLATELAEKDNRRLVAFDLPGSGLAAGAGAGAGSSGTKIHAEMYLASGDGRVVRSFFPFFAFFVYTSGQTYRLTSEISYTSDMLFQMARKELEKFNPYLGDKDDKGHLSYVVKRAGGGADFFFDLASQTNVVEKGVMLCISSDAFSADDKLKHHAAEIIDRWDYGGDSDSD